MTIKQNDDFLKIYMQMYFFEIDLKLSPLNDQLWLFEATTKRSSTCYLPGTDRWNQH